MLKSANINKALRIFLSFSLLFQSFAPALLFSSNVAYAQDATDSSTVIPTETLESTTSPVITETPTPEPSPTEILIPTENLTENTTPTETITPEPTPEPALEITSESEVSPTVESTTLPTSEPLVTISPSPIPTDPSSDEISTPEVELTVPATEVNGDLNTYVAQNVEADSVNLDSIDPENVEQTAKLATDKADYAPTDTAIITGTGFIPGQTYILKIYSTDSPPTTTEAEVTADENGQFVYAYQLDGTYRPNYTVEAKDSVSGELLAETTFTDAGSLTEISINDVSVTEGNSGTKIVSFTVTATRGANGDVEVNYTTANNTATGGSSCSGSTDYLSTNGILTWTGNTAPPQTISVTICGDTNVEINETFYVNLSSGSKGSSSFTDNQGQGTILNDDVVTDTTPPVITVTGANPITVAYGSIYSDAGATASDINDGNLTSTIVTVNPVNTSIVADYTVTYDVTDAAGNTAVQKTRTVHVVKADQTITFGTLADKTYGDADFDVSATATSGLPVAFIASGNCSMADADTVHITGAGSCTITAYQGGDGSYNPAPDVPQSFNINRKGLLITASNGTMVYGGTVPTITPIYTGLQAGNLAPATPPTCSTLATGTSGVGSYASSCSGAVDANYTITYVAGSVSVTPASLLIKADNKSKQYSDPLPDLTVSYIGLVNGDLAPATLPTISTTGLVLSPIGTYLITATGAVDPNYIISYTDGTLTVTLENVAIEYTGDTFVFTTAGPTITNAPIRLSAKLTQEADGNLGDLSLAKVTFELTPTGGGSTITVPNIPVSAAGDTLTTKTVPVGDYTVKVTISSGNVYWTQNPYDEGILDVVLGSLDQRVTGGGWIPDALSKNGKDNFGFTVNYKKNGAPKGNFLFMFRETDGYNYQLKSNSWATGGLSFTGTNGAYFTAKATLSKIDRTTGQVVSSDGNYTFAVNITDGKLIGLKRSDTFAITIFYGSGLIWKQVGTALSPINLGGGSIVVHSK